MNITQIVPAELSGFCDVATGECIVVDATPQADADSHHGGPVRPEEPDKRSAPAARVAQVVQPDPGRTRANIAR